MTFLNGPRQAGKSTLVQDLNDLNDKDFPAEYISFDKPVQMAAAAHAPQAFLNAHKDALIIDEMQMCQKFFMR